MSKHKQIALIGNPNSGKSSLFNLLTGLKQKIGNYPGVTVDKKTGFLQLDNQKVEIIDLPGTYSLYPRSADEKVVIEVLSGNVKPSIVIGVADMTNLERSLLLFSQIADLQLPIILVLTMSDVAAQKEIKVDLERLSEMLGNIKIVVVNPRTGEGLSALKQAITEPIAIRETPFFDVEKIIPIATLEKIAATGEIETNHHHYLTYQLLHQQLQKNQSEKNQLQENQFAEKIKAIIPDFDAHQAQIIETKERYFVIRGIVSRCVSKQNRTKTHFSQQLDRWLTHPIAGYGIFFFVLLLIFQVIFQWSSVPMDAIDSGFSWLATTIKTTLPAGVFTDLLAEGIIPGIGGIVIFAPQIAMLFMFIALLEETGYMARVVFLMDKIMRQFGLNGRSAVPLISGVACAIPAIMATRTIENWKERLITIFVTPLMSCSARLPVFTVLIGLVVPEQRLFGLFDMRGIALMGAYLIGFVAAILSAWVMKILLQSKEKSFLIMELPDYKKPRWANIGLTVYEKVKTFVTEPGKIILSISVILWLLSSYGSGDALERAEASVVVPVNKVNRTEADSTAFAVYQNEVAAKKLQASYAGQIGKWIEPAIAPLGYDWKIGIALITSFAAREVFISTISTLYSIGQDQEESTIQSRLKAEINPDTGKPRFTLAVSSSLLVFYIFAMQCMSTFAVVVRETKSWRWAIIQLIYLTVLAYVSAWLVYIGLS